MTSEHEEISFQTIQYLTILDGQLYWKGNKLKTETVQHFALSFWQWATGAVIALGAVLAPSITYVAELEKICNVTRNAAPLCSRLDIDARLIQRNTSYGKVPPSPAPAAQPLPTIPN